MSYKELDELTANFAAKLQADGIRAGDRVAIAVDRSEQLIIGVLSILRAGACYVPCDISYPKDRLAKIIDIAKPQAIISDNSALSKKDYPELSFYSVEDITKGNNYQLNKVTLKEDDPAYIIFTSGSTGDPKGVTLPHRALYNLLVWQDNSYKHDGKLRTLQYTPIGFDVSFQEIGSNILQGGELYIIDQASRLDPIKFLNFIIDNDINRIFLPFVAFQALCETVIF